MKVVVIGAGIGGMCAAIALRQIGHDVSVHDQVTENRPVGAAITVWGNGVKCLNYLGLGDRIRVLGGVVDHMSYMDGLTGESMCRFGLQPLIARVGQRHYPVARADLQLMLMAEFGLDEIGFGMRMVGIEDGGETVTAHFADGSTATGDLLIGADGAKSLTREYVVGAPADRRYSGYVNVNGLVPIDENVGPADQWTTFVGEGKRVSVMPVADDRFYYFFDVNMPPGLPYERGVARDMLTEHFGHWADPVRTLVDQVDPQSANRVEIWDLDPFHTWVRGRVALLGDAAHNTTPDIGQGGCAAMEDAVALQLALRTNTLGVEDALRRYQQRRSERAAELVLRARRRADVTHGTDMAATEAWYAELRREDGASIIDGIARTCEGALLG